MATAGVAREHGRSWRRRERSSCRPQFADAGDCKCTREARAAATSSKLRCRSSEFRRPVAGRADEMKVTAGGDRGAQKRNSLRRNPLCAMPRRPSTAGSGTRWRGCQILAAHGSQTSALRWPFWRRKMSRGTWRAGAFAAGRRRPRWSFLCLGAIRPEGLAAATWNAFGFRMVKPPRDRSRIDFHGAVRVAGCRSDTQLHAVTRKSGLEPCLDHQAVLHLTTAAPTSTAACRPFFR